MPLKSHGPHTYAFQLFALDQVSALPDGFTLDDVTAAITGHVIGRARLGRCTISAGCNPWCLRSTS